MLICAARVGLVNYYFWTLLTTSFMESNIIKLMILLPICLLVLSELERLKARRWILFYAVASIIITNFLASTLQIFLYLGFENEQYLFRTMSGLMTMLIVLIVGVLYVSEAAKYTSTSFSSPPRIAYLQVPFRSILVRS